MIWCAIARDLRIQGNVGETIAAKVYSDPDDYTVEPLAGSKLLHDEYLHAQYHFRLARQNMRREGQGELWLSFADQNPQVRIKGSAHSPRFGEGEITIVAD